MSTSPSFIDRGVPHIAPGYRFQWEDAQQGHVILYPEGMVKLNASASEILKLCDGARNVAAIIQTLQEQFAGTDLSTDIRTFLEAAHDRGWISFEPREINPSQGSSGLTTRPRPPVPGEY